MKADIEGLVTEKEALQKEGGNQQQAASEKESLIHSWRKSCQKTSMLSPWWKKSLKKKKGDQQS